MYENLTRLDLVGPALARALGDPGWERLEASLVSGGKSNLTFVLSSDAGEAVLRRPPDGPLLPRAHDMGREARGQRALAGTPRPGGGTPDRERGVEGKGGEFGGRRIT